MKKVTDSDLAEILQNTISVLDHFRGKSIFITGATGFFGKWLTQVLLKANREFNLNLHLTLLSRSKERVLSEQPWLSDRCVEILSGDVRHFQLIQKSFDYFIHGATAASATLNDTSPGEMADTIIDGTKRVLEQAKLSDCPRFLFLSSGAVYGSQSPEVPYSPESILTGPDITQAASAYGEAKRMAELYCQFAQRQGEIKLSIARCYAFLGPYLPIDQHFAAGNFVQDVLLKKTITLSGDGTPYRSYMYPTDLIEWLLVILIKAKPGAFYNVGSDQEIQLKDLALLIDHQRAKFDLKINQPGLEVLGLALEHAKRNAYIPSTEKAHKDLGLKIRVGLEETIIRTISWHLNSGERNV
jgi:dTDP-glucose 4,6-dehydratase